MYKIVKAIMKLFPAHPVPDPTYREVFNLREFRDASEEKKKKLMLQTAEDKFHYESEYPFHLRFKMSKAEMINIAAKKNILEIGCYVGGGARYFLDNYQPYKYYGIDIDDVFIETANYYNCDRLDRMEFKKGFAEQLDFSDNFLDVIFSFNVLEHVFDPRKALMEAWRVLKPGGKLFIVFPSFYYPWGNHLTMVTWAPWLQLFFSDAAIEKAYLEIIEERGDEAYWYKSGNSMEMHRGRFYEVNGITTKSFRRDAGDIGFKISKWVVNPILISGRKTVSPWIKRFANKPLAALAGMSFFEEFFLNHVTAVLEKDEE